jgi:superfamily II DNA or RNA helicase
VVLSDEEQREWDQNTNKIRQLYARGQSGVTEQQALSPRIKQLLIDRSRIAKGAKAKVALAVGVLRKHYTRGQRWIVYCDTQIQLSEVLTALRANGLDALEYHSVMQGDREQTLRHFELNGGILVSIRCLDEGVNIPAISHALILWRLN